MIGLAEANANMISNFLFQKQFHALNNLGESNLLECGFFKSKKWQT